MSKSIFSKKIDRKTLLRIEPDITLKFPFAELILLLCMMLIVIRLLFKKEIIQTEKIIARDIRRIEAGLK